MSYELHRQAAARVSVGCAIITLSDTRTEETDTSGAAIRRLLTSTGHCIAHYQICRDEPSEFDSLLAKLLARDDIEAIITNGGTGISRRDQTIPVIRRRLDLVLDGFGELFRMLSWPEIRSGAMLSRAVGGVARGKLIFALPGSTKAVEMGMIQLILPELGHLATELKK